MINISVIICTYNREKYIPGLLKSLDKQTLQKEKFEIIFINNNSPDNTEDVVKGFRELHPGVNLNYYKETNQGLSYARNRGIKESKSNLLVFIDDDAIAREDYLENIVGFFYKHPEIDAAGGKILPKYEVNPPSWMNHFLKPLLSVLDLGEKPKEIPKNKFPIGANMVFRKKVFEKTELFNTNLGRTGKNMLGGEEKDLFFRMRSKGMKIFYFPDAQVWHIIPPERLTVAFIRKQALGIGKSEKIRTRDKSIATFFKALIKESMKWGASVLLFFFYFLTIRPAKGIMILRFRFWVTKGIIL